MASTTPVRGQPLQWERGESVAYSEQDPGSHHHGKPTMERPRGVPRPSNPQKGHRSNPFYDQWSQGQEGNMKHLWMYKASWQGSTHQYHNSKRGPTLYCSRVLGYRKPQSPLYWSGEQEATPVQISKRPKTADRELESWRIGSPPRHEWVRATPLDPRRPKPEGEDSLHGDRRSFQTRTITGPQANMRSRC